MSGGSVITALTQERAVFPAFSSREITSGQMRKIGIHFIIYPVARVTNNRVRASDVTVRSKIRSNLPHQLSKGGDNLRPLRNWGSERGQRRVLGTGSHIFLKITFHTFSIVNVKSSIPLLLIFRNS